MRGGPTPAWTLILVPPTPKASTKRVGVKSRTVRTFTMLVLATLISATLVTWSRVQTQASVNRQMADRLAAQERLLGILSDSLDSYRSSALAVRAARLPPPDMQMPLAGRITSWFSRARRHPILRIYRPHRGIDVAAASGTRIVAPATAVVASVARNFSYGLTVELVHSGGVVTRYAHLRSATVRPGERVMTGQTIATVGSSGLSSGPHLHFEVLLKGTAVDPIRFLASTRSAPAASLRPGASPAATAGLATVAEPSAH